MNEKEAKRLSLELMESTEAVYLTTVDRDGFPQTRAMLNLRRKEQFPRLCQLFKKYQEDFLIFFTTNTSSAKVNHMKENPKVSVYYCKPSEWRGLMLSGEIEIVTNMDIKKALWQDGWEMYYPGGVTDPDYAILSLRPISAKYYHQLNFAAFNFSRKS